MDEDDLPISAVEHYAYCPRQAALIHGEGVWDDNVHTALGSAQHQAVDRATRMVRRNGVDTWLSLPVRSDELGVTGICDAVEFDPHPVPVEYKPIRTRYQRGSVSQQLAGQAMCLEVMFDCEIPHAVVFATKEHRRQEIPLDDTLRRTSANTVRSVRKMLQERTLPPRVSDRRCHQCSLRDVCLVDDSGQPFSTRWAPPGSDEEHSI